MDDVSNSHLRSVCHHRVAKGHAAEEKETHDTKEIRQTGTHARSVSIRRLFLRS